MKPERDKSGDTPIDAPLTSEQSSRMLRRIDKALIGDPFNPNEPGFIAIMTEMYRDYYGDKKTGRMGTKDMVMKLWEIRYKIIGGVVALSGVISVAAWLVENFLAKH